MLPFRAPAVYLAALLGPSLVSAQVTFTQIALTGDPAPGVADGAEFEFFLSPSLNASGDVAFLADLRTGTGAVVDNNNREAIFGPTTGAGSALGLIAREDALAPGVADGAEFDFFFSPSLNASGDVAFLAMLRTGMGAAVNINNDQALFGPGSGAGSSLGLIAREDAPAPGVADGAEFDGFAFFISPSFNFISPSLNSSGDVAFFAVLRTGTGNPVGSNNNQALFGPTSGAGSPLGLIVREGGPAPGVADGAEFSGFSLFDSPSLNVSGDVAFAASLRTGTGAVVDDDNSRALFGPTSGAGSPLGLIAREGAPAPGVTDGAEFDLFFDFPSLNASGDVTFSAELRTGTGNPVGSNNRALFGPTSGAGSPLGLIARGGAPAPGVADGAEFSAFGAPSLNATGDVSFMAFLRTGTGAAVDGSNNEALFTSIAGQLQLVVREGDLFAVTLPGGSATEDRTISAINFSSTGLNDAGTLAFRLNFTDGTSGIFTASMGGLAFLEGDYNGDGFVAQADLDLVLLNWGDGVAPAGFEESNLPGGGPFDGLLSQNELDGVLLNWGDGSPPAIAIPEPGAAAMWLAVLGVTGRRRRVD